MCQPTDFWGFAVVRAVSPSRISFCVVVQRKVRSKRNLVTFPFMWLHGRALYNVFYEGVLEAYWEWKLTKLFEGHVNVDVEVQSRSSNNWGKIRFEILGQCLLAWFHCLCRHWLLSLHLLAPLGYYVSIATQSLGKQCVAWLHARNMNSITYEKHSRKS